jgi:glycoprotein endo-alpha-1,2-mannosidase
MANANLKILVLLGSLLVAHVAAFNTDVHAFYYLWYGTPEVDGNWSHWNHGVLQHWIPSIQASYPTAAFIPPHDIHAPFYPAIGLYSSKNQTVVLEHMRDMYQYGIGVVVISWWGRPSVSKGDSQGIVTDSSVAMVLEAAARAGMKVALHLEPYEGRSADSVREDLFYLNERYGEHPALYRVPATAPVGQVDRPRLVPVYYVYDSYHIAASEWARLLKGDGPSGVRGTNSDGFFIGLWLEQQHGEELATAGFNGAYTYFAAEGFSYGSTIRHWPRMATFAQQRGLKFIPSVGPGYDDSRIRPWNAAHRRDRESGEYYRRMWQAALGLEAQPWAVSITSFNEWGEGTQIEAAVPRSINVGACQCVKQHLSGSSQCFCRRTGSRGARIVARNPCQAASSRDRDGRPIPRLFTGLSRCVLTSNEGLFFVIVGAAW